MDPTPYIVDPEGDVLLAVKERGLRMIMSIEIDAPPTPMSQPASGGLLSTWDYPPVIQHVRVRVSSKRLSLVSPYFREILQAMPFTSSVRIEVDIPLAADELEAFVILLDIIHCHSEKVPRFLNFEQVFSIMALASLYRCMQVVQEYADGWLEHIKGDVPVEYSWDLLRWIWVSFTYRKDLLFKQTTRLALRHENGPIVNLGLQIPQTVIDMIENFRQKNIGHIINMIHRQIECMIEGSYCCDSCDALSLGSLLQCLKQKGLYPPPEAPFKGVSFADLLASLPTIPSSGCSESIHPVTGCEKTCEIMEDILDELENLDRQTTGLNLADVLLDV